MTTSEIVASAIAVLSLVVSGVTAYLTLLSRFKGVVLPKRRPILTHITDTPYLILECEFFNNGAKPGSIEDIVVTIVHDETGTPFLFAPKYVTSQINILGNQLSDLAPFSGISLSSRERRELYVAFKPLAQFAPPKSGIFTIYVRAKVDGNSKWISSPRPFSLRLNERIVDKWTSSSGETIQIEAIEIGKDRTQYFGGSQR